jgi:hypothetical protein
MEVDDGTKFGKNKLILDANLDRINMLTFDEFMPIVLNTLQSIVDIIIPLCGPKAVHDLVIYDHLGSNFVSNVFTNDGIHILKHTEYMSPIQTYIANYIRYIAERVDRASGDGTSTAIYLSSSIISMIFQKLELIRGEIATDSTISEFEITREINIATKQVSEYILSTLKLLLERIEDFKIDINSVSDEFKKEIIYKLAYTASKGDEILSKYTVELFSNLPEILYEQKNYKRSNMETDEVVSIEVPEYDAIISAVPSGNTQYNTELYTELLYEHCDILVCPFFLYDDTKIFEYISNRREGLNLRNLVILYSGCNDNIRVKLESAIDPQSMTLCKYTAYVQSFVNNPIELLSLLSMSEVDISKLSPINQVFEDMLIKDVKCHIKEMTIRIYGLFESEGYFHPNFVHKNNQGYNGLVSDIETKIKSLKLTHSQIDTSRDKNEFARIYRMLVCSKLPVLVIGGPTIDHLLYVNVVDDVLGSTSVAMKHGVVSHLIPTLLACAGEIDDRSDSFEIRDSNRTRYLYGIDLSIIGILEDFIKLTYGYCDNADMIESIEYLSVVQSYKSIHETITRLIETIPKLIMVDRIIVPNSVTQQRGS